MSTFYHADLGGELREAIRRHEDSLLKMCRFIWENPELGLKEVKACEVQTRLLQDKAVKVVQT